MKRHVAWIGLVFMLTACPRTPPDPARVVELYREERYDEAIAIAEQLVRQEIDLEISLNNLGLLYRAVGRYEDAVGVLEDALVLTEASWGADDPTTATSLNNLAGMYRVLGRFEEAESLYLRAIAIYEAHDLTADVAMGLDNVAALYEEIGDYAEAEPLFERALALREAEGDPSAIATSLNNLGMFYYTVGRYTEAEPLILRSQSLRSPDTLSAATSLNNLAALYKAMGRYSEAEPLYEEALALTETILGSDHPEIATSLNNLAALYRTQGRYRDAETLLLRALAIQRLQQGNYAIAFTLNTLGLLYRDMGRYIEAEPQFRESLAILTAALGEDNTHTTTSLNNLALLLDTLGRSEEAEALYRRSLEATRAALGEANPETATSLHNLATALYESDPEAAEKLLQESLTIRQETLGETHPAVAFSFNTLAWLYDHQGRYAEAEPLYLEANQILTAALGETHPTTAVGLSNLAETYRNLGRYAEAEQLFDQAHAIMAVSLPEQHPDRAILLNNWSTLAAEQSDYERSLSYLEEGLAIEENMLSRTLPSQTDDQQRAYLATLERSLDQAIALHLDHLVESPAAARLALTTILQRKGRILDTLSNQRQQLRSRVDGDDQRRLDRLTTLYAQLAESYGDVEEPEATEAITSEIASLEQALAQRSDSFRTLITPVSIEAVQANLPADAVLIEYQRYTPIAAEPRYVAYVLAPDGDPVGFDLGSASAIDTAVNDLRAALEDRSVPYVQLQQLSQRVYDLVLAPLPLADHLLIAPDGLLNLLPFTVLAGDRGLVLEQHLVTYLTTGRDLLSYNLRRPQTNSSAIFANPTYHALAALPGTSAEADAIAPLLNSPQIFTEAAATKEALYTLETPKILHLATHGLFEPTPHPLLSSGLALASSEDQESILTALEVTTLDLWGTELVVLSACDTGLGDIVAGEGVYGLRRALSLAGAASSVVSLWSVDDLTTKTLMSRYYTSLLNDGMSRTAALQEAQLSVMRNPETQHPYYWAAFIPTGDWRPLP